MHDRRDHKWTSLNTRLLRSVTLVGALLIVVSVSTLYLTYESALERELTSRAQSLVLHTEAVIGLLEYQEDLEWHLVSLQKKVAELEAISIVEQGSGKILASTETVAPEVPGARCQVPGARCQVQPWCGHSTNTPSPCQSAPR